MSEQPRNSSATMGGHLDRYGAAFAVVLSLAALFVSLAEVSSERAQQLASVWPHIEIGESYSDKGFTLRMTNKGVGPALMGRLILRFDGQEITDIDQLIVDTLGAEDAFSYERYGMSDPSNSVVAPADQINLFSVDWDADTQRLIQAWNGRIDISTCYCSIHNDCWETSLNSAVNQRTETCRTGISL